MTTNPASQRNSRKIDELRSSRVGDECRSRQPPTRRDVVMAVDTRQPTLVFTLDRPTSLLWNIADAGIGLLASSHSCMNAKGGGSAKWRADDRSIDHLPILLKGTARQTALARHRLQNCC
jgi:hypothetical protein